MAFTPLQFYKDGKVTTAETPSGAVWLKWTGWRLDGPAPEPHPSQVDASMADLAELEERLMGQVGGGGVDEEALAEAIAPFSDALAVVADTTPLLEEIAVSVVVNPGSVTTTTTQAIYVAPFPCRLEQISFSFAAAVAASATDYWTVELQRYRAGTPASIGSKTTREAVNGEPVAAYAEWEFDLVPLSNNDLLRGDIITVKMTPTGSPAPLAAPVVTFRVPVADTEVEEPEPEPEATLITHDQFTRANQAGLGTTPQGHTWAPGTNAGVYSIVNNEAAVTTAGAARYVIESGAADHAAEVKVVSIGTSGTGGPVVRYSSDAAHYYTAFSGIFRADTGNVATFTPSVGAGDTIRLEAIGDTVSAYIDYGSTGTFVLGASYTDPAPFAGTKVGLRNTGNGHKWDDFKAYGYE